MGGDYGQFIEWKYYDSLDWHLLDYDKHRQLHEFMRSLNYFYTTHREFWEEDCDWSGFRGSVATIVTIASSPFTALAGMKKTRLSSFVISRLSYVIITVSACRPKVFMKKY